MKLNTDDMVIIHPKARSEIIENTGADKAFNQTRDNQITGKVTRITTNGTWIRIIAAFPDGEWVFFSEDELVKIEE